MNRILELDSIRGIAAVAIMINHLPFTSRFFRLGAYGVDLFFVLSGYLITTIILKNAGSSGFLRAFYVRRSLRIWPIYYLVLISVIAINPAFRPPFRLDGWPYYATYTQGIQGYWFGRIPAFSPLMDHTWTLALEEQYYLIWPAMVLLCRSRVIPLALAFAGVSIAARSAGFSERLLIGRSDGFALGGLLAAILLDIDAVRRSARAYLLGFAAVAAVAVATPTLSGLVGRLATGPAAAEHLAGSIRLASVTTCFFAIVGALLILAGSPALRPLRDPRLCYLGQISYGLYLYHYPIYYLLDAWTGRGADPWMIALKMAASLCVAIASWRLIERPILRWKDYFRYRRVPDPMDAVEPMVPTTEASS